MYVPKHIIYSMCTLYNILYCRYSCLVRILLNKVKISISYLGSKLISNPFYSLKP